MIDVNNLSKQFPKNEQPVVQNISFSVGQGEVLALLGPNGAGKTTTIKMILGLIEPTAGEITVCGHDMCHKREIPLGVKHTGAVLEGARNSYWRLTAWDNLIYFGSLRGLAKKKLHDRANYLLDFFDLTDSAEKEVRLFSRGMQQKLAIALAMLHDPDVLILDEPTLGLDVTAARLLEQRISELAAQGKAILLTTHTMPLAERLASRIFIINRGQEVAYGQTHVLLKNYDQSDVVDLKLVGQMGAVSAEKVQQTFPVILIQNDPSTTLTWSAPTQTEILQLYKLLDQLGETVDTLQRRQPTLEEMFVTLTTLEQPA